MGSGKTACEAPDVQDDVLLDRQRSHGILWVSAGLLLFFFFVTPTYRFELIVRVRDARRVELGAEVVTCNDIARDARKWTWAHANQQPLAGRRRPDNLARAQRPPLFLLPRQRVDNLLVDGDGDGVGRVAVGVGLRNHAARRVKVALVGEPAGALGNKRQHDDAQQRKEALEQRRRPPRPRRRPLARAQRDARGNQRADIVKVVQEADAPGSPPAGKGLGQVHAGGDARDGGSEPEDDARDHKHGNVLRCRLQDHTDNGHQGAPEYGEAATEPVGEDARDKRTQDAAYKDGGGVEAGGGGRELEVFRVRGQDVETVEHGAIIAICLANWLGKMQQKGPATLTEDCTTEQRMRRTERAAVDSGTHAGNHVPVGELRSMFLISFSQASLVVILLVTTRAVQGILQEVTSCRVGRSARRRLDDAPICISAELARGST